MSNRKEWKMEEWKMEEWKMMRWLAPPPENELGSPARQAFPSFVWPDVLIFRGKYPYSKMDEIGIRAFLPLAGFWIFLRIFADPVSFRTCFLGEPVVISYVARKKREKRKKKKKKKKKKGGEKKKKKKKKK